MPKRRRESKVMQQVRAMVRLAKESGCHVFKYGEFYVRFGPSASEPHDAVGFDVSPSPPDELLEDRKRKP